MQSQDKEFADETFENIRTSDKHEYFELACLHYHWDRIEQHRSLYFDKKITDLGDADRHMSVMIDEIYVHEDLDDINHHYSDNENELQNVDISPMDDNVKQMQELKIKLDKKIHDLTHLKIQKWQEVVKNEKSIKELKKEDPRYSEKKKELRHAIDVLIIEESSLDASIKSLTQKREMIEQKLTNHKENV
ncbi:unnamed protein product [Rotaria sordida]|uniref:Uncharacterized protein n=1 Tax=Rotaria sordida TaxID=392033 RepID=A0A815Z4Z9_9BILA|nr:unnamed protein product [Rotaria sordida]CAF1578227.1 unnamed protein product [Rotaria sordida]